MYSPLIYISPSFFPFASFYPYLSPLLPSFIFPTCSLSSSEDAPFRGGCPLSMARGGAYLPRTRNQSGYMKGPFLQSLHLDPHFLISDIHPYPLLSPLFSPLLFRSPLTLVWGLQLFLCTSFPIPLSQEPSHFSGRSPALSMYLSFAPFISGVLSL